MRVLHVAHSAQPGGSNEILASLVRHRPPGAECDCVFLEGGPAEEVLRAAGARTAVVESGRARQAWRAPGVIRRLRAAIREGRPDLVMGHVSKAHLYAAPAARLETVPYLWHQPERRAQKPRLHALAGRLPAGAVICLSDFTAAEQAAANPRVPVRRVHPGPELGELGPLRRHSRGSGDAVLLGVVGRLQRWKRVELALAALPGILREEPAVRLRVAGDAWPGLDDDYPGWLRGEADRLGVTHAVDFAGHLPGAGAAMEDLDLLLHTAEHEPFGLVLVEAMLRGIPPVSSHRGGPAEIVRDGVDGLLVEAERPEALAAAVVALARDPRRRTEMGAAGRGRALERFTAERMAGEMWAICEAVATGAPLPEAA